MTRLGAILAGAAVLVVAGYGMAEASSPVGPPIASGPITLIGTTAEHFALQPDHQFPGRESWKFSLASSRAKGKPFGYAVLACSYVSVKTTLRQCAGTFSLPRGKITVAGSFLYPGVYGLAVTGGVDYYVGVGGSVFAQRVAKGSYWFTFSLR